MTTGTENPAQQARSERQQQHEISGDTSRRQGRPWILPIMVLGLFMASAARQLTRPIADYDTFWHLRLGYDILRTRSLTEPASSWSELSQQDWVPTQWLTEIVAAKIHAWWGLPGVAVLFAAGVMVLIVLVFSLCRAQAGSFVAAFVTGLCVVAMAASLSPRPHIVTYILLAITLSAWLRTCDDLKPRWWLVALTWVWSMSHGMWFIGPLLGAVVTVGLLADRCVAPRDAARLFAVPGLSVVAAGMTPLGPELLQAPFAVAGVSAFITEWQAPSFRSLGPATAMAMVALIALVWARQVRPTPWAKVAVLLLGTAWILLSARTVTLGALLVAPLLADALQLLIRQPRDVPRRRELATVWSLAVVCLSAVALTVPTTAKDPAAVPSGLGSTLSSLPEGSVVLNSYELGGWLRWAHPDLEPVVDGMTEAYSVSYLSDYHRVTSVTSGWSNVVRDYGADYALLPEPAPLALALRERSGWHQVSTSGGYVLLRSPSAPN